MTYALDHGYRMTVDEFLAWDDGESERYELIDGEPVMMAPGSAFHAFLSARLGTLLSVALEPLTGFAVYSQGGVSEAGWTHSVYAPDIAVTRGLPTRGQHLLQHPVLVAEILSPSTETIDWRKKQPDYQSIVTLQDILLIGQDRPLVDHFFRDSVETAVWQHQCVSGPSDEIALRSAPIRLPLAKLYKGLPMDSDLL